MIQLNLLPEELRPKIKDNKKDLQSFIRLLPFVFAGLIIIHLVLAVLSLARSATLSSWEQKWKGLEPDRKTLENLRQEYNILSQDTKALQDIFAQRFSWSQKLNRLSFNLPSGIWFSEISLSGKDFTLKGSVVSFQKDELNLINQLLANLKADNSFFNDFASIELGAVQRRTIASYEVVDFNISLKLK